MMIDLGVFKGEKKENQAIDLLNALVEMREMYNQLLNIAHSKQGYTEQQIREAKELTSNGFHVFISKMMSFKNK